MSKLTPRFAPATATGAASRARPPSVRLLAAPLLTRAPLLTQRVPSIAAPDNIDKASSPNRSLQSHQADSPSRSQWYCSSCVAASASSSTPLRTTYILSPLSSLASSRSSSPAVADTPHTSAPTASSADTAPPPPPPTAAPPPASAGRRKSSRSTRAQGIDYANLDAHLPATVDRWSSTISAREASGAIVDGFAGEGAFRRFEDGHELSREGDEWVYGDKGITEPFVVVKEDGLGLKMPRHLTVKQVAELVGASILSLGASLSTSREPER